MVAFATTYQTVYRIKPTAPILAAKPLSPILQSRADGYFTFREVDRRHVAIILSKSVQDLTDQSKPTSDIRYGIILYIYVVLTFLLSSLIFAVGFFCIGSSIF